VLAFSRVAATEENRGFLHSFPFPTIAYTSCAVFFGQILASWIPKLLGVISDRGRPSNLMARFSLGNDAEGYAA
jgi:hypothetical protein